MHKHRFLIACVALASTAHGATSPDLYQKNTSQAIAIYQKMTLDEKIGQLIQPSYSYLAQSVSPQGEACTKILRVAKADEATITRSCGLDLIKQYHLGSVLSGGDPYYNEPTLANWVALNALATKEHRIGNPLDPRFLIGNDAIHGNVHVEGAVIFPHNIGLGVTHDTKLVKQIGSVVGRDSLASGFNWIFMPTVAIAHDLRWGRTYESFGQQGELVKALAKAYVGGFQRLQGDKLLGPLATAKHFIGDGATQYGFDEGDDAYTGTQTDFWRLNGEGYEGALQAHVATIMTSYSSMDDSHTDNATQMHFGGKWDILKQFTQTGITGTDGQAYRFSGIVVSDWNGPTRAAYFYSKKHPALTLSQTMAKTINSGVDIIMVGQTESINPFDHQSKPSFTSLGDVFTAIKTAYEQGLISDVRLQDAVMRILTVKLAMNPQVPTDYAALQAQERQLALKAASESLVLLKNDHKTLPLNKSQVKYVLFSGETNDLGLQNGAWTVTWQGQKSNRYFTGKNQISSGALTLEEGIKASVGPGTLFYHGDEALPRDANASNSVVIALLAEVPYAEFTGDIANSQAEDPWYLLNAGRPNGKPGTNIYMGLPQNHFMGLRFSDKQAMTIARMKKQGIPIVTVIYSGRPMILNEGLSKAPLPNSDALIAAFLPGTLGGRALSDAIFGSYHFKSKGQSNTLTFPWPQDMTQVADHFSKGALFPIGYGLAD